jgi:HK97 family phage major capsid protein
LVLHEIKSATALVEQRDGATRSRLNSLEVSINDLMRRAGRPTGGDGRGETDERAQAVGLLEMKHFSVQTKVDPTLPAPTFSEEQVSEARTAIAGLRHLMHATSVESIPFGERKALSAFSFGSQGFILPAEMSNEILSCLADVTTIAGLVKNITISGPSIRFMVDNELWDLAGWACESSCFANSPTQQIGQGIGEVELKAESLRYVVCAGRELLEDSSVNIEAWLLQKADAAFRFQISAAILAGDGFGKPQGILHPSSGIPIMDTAPSTPPGFFTWQDLLSMKWSLPVQYQRDAVFVMNPHTMGLLMTMSDANSRPIMTPTPAEGAGFLLGGSPIIVAEQMPDVVPGATPVLYANLRALYTLVTRRALTFQNDPYSAGWCTLMKFDCRVGGGVVCANAGRMLRIR